MGVKIWVGWDSQYERYYLVDFPSKMLAGPIEISNELYERFMEHERQDQVLQDLLAGFEYEWLEENEFE